ncbi:hypothetical protein PMAYCL1PPCAC_20338, partial [Pristionchus mayeri]
PVFKSMFSGDWAENETEEIEIKEVVYEEFVNLIEFMFSFGAQITDSTVPHILALAFRFEMKSVVDECEFHLLVYSTSLSTTEKMYMSDKYKLDRLKHNCLQSYSSTLELCILESTPEYAKLSADMKGAIFDRLMKLVEKEANGEAVANSNAGSDRNTEYIKLKVAFEGGRDFHFLLKHGAHMWKLKKSYADRVGLPVTYLRFLFDGRRINDDDTARSLEMEEDEEIEVYREQGPGFLHYQFYQNSGLH